MSLVKTLDFPKLEKVASVENVKCKCFNSKCCSKTSLIFMIKERTISFIRKISGSNSSEDVENLK